MQERQTEKKEQFKLPLRMYIVYLLIASFLCTGVAFSKYITTGMTASNARVAKLGDVIITESGNFFSRQKVDDTTEDTFVLTPGANIDMQTDLRFTGSEMACYIFLRMTQEGFDTSDGVHFSHDGGKVTWAMDSAWSYLKEEDGTYIYYFIVAANDALENKAIIASPGGTVSSEVTKTELANIPFDQLEIDFKASAVQYDGFGDFATEEEHALAAWASLCAH